MKLRDGMVYEISPSGGYMGWMASSEPHIQANADGPLLVMRNGELHWLTLRERLALFLGRTDAIRLERKYRPQLAIMARASMPHQ